MVGPESLISLPYVSFSFLGVTLATLVSFKTVFSGQDAKIICDLLNSHGVEAFCNGGREYSSLIVGGDYGRFEISVPENQLEEARKILISSQVVSEDQIIEETPNPKLDLKRAVVHGALANFMLPIIFNYSSLISFQKYIRNEPPSAKKWAWAGLILTLNLTALITAYLLLSSLIQYDFNSLFNF